MTCRQCGSPTSRQVCLSCSRMDRAEEIAQYHEEQFFECPICGKNISIVEEKPCSSCRGRNAEGSEGGPSQRGAPDAQIVSPASNKASDTRGDDR